MGADISRVSFDEAQQYRRVAAQQGRVLADTDLTDAARLLAEEQRREALDVVGPSGTPDNGYEVSIPAGPPAGPKFDFDMAKGTYYVGGLRVELRSAISYANQPDWLSPSPSPGQLTGARECIVLRLREYEVGAVEDPALREVALGGTDTSQRTRLMQQAERHAVSATDCDAAFAQVQKQWTAQGLHFDARTMRLEPLARLQVSFEEPATPADRCQPEASGGYLGADNQLIRVQVAAHDRLVWGFDNASFLYRVEVIDLHTLRLRNRPVDIAHQPRLNQTVEVLRATAKLPNSDTVAGPGTHATDGAYVAAPVGKLCHLTANYDPDTQTVTLDHALTGYETGDDLPPLFLRVWEEDKAFKAKEVIALGATGLRVTLTGKVFAPGAYWTFAVRPFTPGFIDPPRYLAAAQAPDGPHGWACCLAVLFWNEDGTLRGSPKDCRDHFDNLVELTRRKLGGCCTINVRVEDARKDGLQAILDRYRNQDEEVMICLMPGVYELPQPLRLTHEHSRLTLEGCHEKVVLAAAPGKETEFIDGLIVLTHADNVTLEGLRFHLPQVPFSKARGKLSGLDSRDARVFGIRQNMELFASIGVRPVHCANLAIRDCLFRFSLTPDHPVFGVGVFAASECWGLSVRGCRFLREEDYPREPEGPFRLLIGYLLSPALVRIPADNPEVSQKPALLLSLLQDASFEGNTFTGLSAAVLAFADVGMVRLTGNLVRESMGGFALFELGTLGADRKLAGLRVPREDAERARTLLTSMAAVLLDPIAVALALALAYPLPEGTDPRHFLAMASPSPEELHEERAHAERLLARLLPPRPADSPTGGEEEVLGEPVLRERRGGPRSAEREGRRVLLERLALFERLPWKRSQRLERVPLSLHCAHNDVEPLAGYGTRWALLVRATGHPEETVLLTANRFRSSSPDFATVSLHIVERCILTGNLLANEAERDSDFQPRSLDLQTTWSAHQFRMVAVTGNIFQGQAADLSRNDYPAPLNSWAPFNTQV